MLYRYYVYYSIIAVTISITLLWHSIYKPPNLLEKKRSQVFLYSLLPFFLIFIAVITTVLLDIQFNFSVIFPLCTIIFFYVYLFTESKHDLFQFLVQIPFSEERAIYKNFTNNIIRYISETQTNERVSLKQTLTAIEEDFIENALKTQDGSPRKAADLLSISLSTIYRHGKKTINNKDLKIDKK